jgi:hypothetical protein
LASATRLVDLAKVIRSKNAGPTHLTVDLMFRDPAGYETARTSPSLTRERIAERYGVSPSSVNVIPYPAAHAIKIVLDRPIIAGTPGDRDVYGAQQHRPLLDLDL